MSLTAWKLLAAATAGCALAGCGSSAPTVVSNAASGASNLDAVSALQKSLDTLTTCVQGSQGLDRSAASICYDGFAYTLDGVNWSASVAPDVASMRTAATDTAGCLKTTQSCDADVARLHMFADRVSAALK